MKPVRQSAPESDEPTRRKAFLLPVQSAPQPGCPGCLATTRATLRTHNCTELGVAFVTARLVCPFCEDDIGDPLALPLTGEEQARSRNQGIARAQTGADILGLNPAEKDAPSTHDEIVNPRNEPAQSAPIFCGRCGTEGLVGESYCRNCGHTTGVQTVDPFPALDGEEGLDRNADTASAIPRNASLIPGYLKGLIVVVVVIAGVLIAAVAFSLSGSGSVESRLEKAILKSDLLNPPGESAYDLYHQLKREGASTNKLASYEAKLLPLLTAGPQRLLADLASPEKNAEMSVAKWEEAAKLLTWASEIRPQEKSLAARAAYCNGRVAYLNEDKSTAFEAWKGASELDRTWALPANHAGLVHTERRESSKAREFFYEAIRREPQWAIPYNNLGTSLYYEKNYVILRRTMNKLADRAPHSRRLHAGLRLDRGDPRRHRLLGDTDFARRGVQAAGVRDGEQHLQRAQLGHPRTQRHHIKVAAHKVAL